MVSHFRNPSTLEAEAKGLLQVQGWPAIHRELHATQGNGGPFTKIHY